MSKRVKLMGKEERGLIEEGRFSASSDSQTHQVGPQQGGCTSRMDEISYDVLEYLMSFLPPIPYLFRFRRVNRHWAGMMTSCMKTFSNEIVWFGEEGDGAPTETLNPLDIDAIQRRLVTSAFPNATRLVLQNVYVSAGLLTDLSIALPKVRSVTFAQCRLISFPELEPETPAEDPTPEAIRKLLRQEEHSHSWNAWADSLQEMRFYGSPFYASKFRALSPFLNPDSFRSLDVRFSCRGAVGRNRGGWGQHVSSDPGEALSGQAAHAVSVGGIVAFGNSDHLGVAPPVLPDLLDGPTSQVDASPIWKDPRSWILRRMRWKRPRDRFHELNPVPSRDECLDFVVESLSRELRLNKRAVRTIFEKKFPTEDELAKETPPPDPGPAVAPDAVPVPVAVADPTPPPTTGYSKKTQMLLFMEHVLFFFLRNSFFGSDFHLVAPRGTCLLHRLATVGSDEAFTFGVRYLEATNSPPENDAILRRMDYHGRTALHILVTQNRVDAISEFLWCLKDPNPRDKLGKTPLFFLAALGQLRRIERFMSMVDRTGAKAVDLNAQDSRGQTLLHASAMSRMRNTHEALVKMGADESIVDVDGKTARQYLSLRPGQPVNLRGDFVDPSQSGKKPCIVM